MNGPGKLVFVPEANIRTTSRGYQPQYVTVSQDVLYEVVADIGEGGHVVTKRNTVVDELAGDSEEAAMEPYDLEHGSG